jgi:hypothetical protein
LDHRRALSCWRHAAKSSAGGNSPGK